MRSTAQVELERRALALRKRVVGLGRALTPEEEKEVNRELGQIRDELARHLMEQMIDNREEVVSRGKPVSGDAARRGLAEARRRLEESHQFRAACSECPAANAWRSVGGGVTVRCGIEKSLLSSETDPQSLLTFCLGDHTTCPTWRAERDREREGRPELVAASEGV